MRSRFYARDWKRILREPVHFCCSTSFHADKWRLMIHGQCRNRVSGCWAYSSSLWSCTWLFCDRNAFSYEKTAKKEKGKKNKRKKSTIGKRNLWIWLKGGDVAEEARQCACCDKTRRESGGGFAGQMVTQGACPEADVSPGLDGLWALWYWALHHSSPVSPKALSSWYVGSLVGMQYKCSCWKCF